jgi:hypothetical protein
MKARTLFALAAALLSSAAAAQATQWQDKFDIAACNPQTTGRNDYFILEPGWQLVLEGGDTRLAITVLDKTRKVDGVMTRAVEEREWKNGELYEVSTNYYAICEKTKDAFYFGEDVDYYEKGKVVKHDGAWLAGVNGSRAGLIMPGTPKVGMRYYQEVAPGVAMDRAEIVSLNETCKTRGGTFQRCMKVKEGTALDPKEFEYKYHAPGVGLVRDADLSLVRHGFLKGY